MFFRWILRNKIVCAEHAYGLVMVNEKRRILKWNEQKKSKGGVRFVHPKNILSTVLESLQEGLCFDIQSKENSFESFGFEPGEKLIKVEDARPSRRGS
ncbi:uncharacterized protein [Henckelia pumila]|uniref:uncharacterized protein isoform X2 n=1 Tax=Henckelia pumila TaxID=405737 RepID=UPI003C6DB99B